MRSRTTRTIVSLVCIAATAPALAENPFGTDEGKLHLTAGFSNVEGSGGGGLVPWAFVTGYGSEDSWGANAHFTSVQLGDYQLDSTGVAFGVLDRLEVSYATHDFVVTGTALDGLSVSQDVIGLKVRLAGDAVYDQDRRMPQLAIGVERKGHGGIDAIGTPVAGVTSPLQLGARDEDGTDIYFAATKLFLAQNLLWNSTLRRTKANQFGLLGFGGDEEDDYSFELETTVGFVLSRRIAVGAEYRTKPDNLGVDEEDNAWDVFIAWTPTKNISFVGAYVDIGPILGPATGQTQNQTGQYLSFQIGF
jgi:hypothetical protein